MTDTPNHPPGQDPAQPYGSPPGGYPPPGPAQPFGPPPGGQAPSYGPPPTGAPSYGPPPADQAPSYGPPPAGPAGYAPAGAPGSAPYPGGYGPPPGAATPRAFDLFAILGFVFCFVCPGLVSGILSLIALRRIGRSGDRGRGLAIAGLVISVIWIGIVGIIVYANIVTPNRDSSGRIAEEGSVTLASLRTGDCLPATPDGAMTGVEVVPCSGPHAAQVVVKFELPAGSYPGQAEAQRLAEEGCISRIDPALAEQIDDDVTLGLSYIYPQGNFSQGRGVACVVFAEQGNLTQVLPTS